MISAWRQLSNWALAVSLALLTAQAADAAGTVSATPNAASATGPTPAAVPEGQAQGPSWQRVFLPVAVRKAGDADRLLINNATSLKAVLAERDGLGIVTFDHKIRINVPHVNEVLPKPLAPLAMTADQMGFTFTLPPGRHISQSWEKNFLAITIPPAAAPVPGEPPPSTPGTVPKATVPQVAAAGPTPDPSSPPKSVPGAAPTTSEPRKPVPATISAAVPDRPAVSAVPVVKAVSQPEPTRLAVSGQPARSGTPGPALAVPGTTLSAATGQGTKISYADIGDGISVRIEWAVPVAAAVFRQDSFVWMIFDRAENFDFRQFQASQFRGITAINQVPAPQATALRLTVVPELQPMVRRAGNAWIVDLRPVTGAPDAPVEPVVHRDAEARVTFAVMQPSHNVSLVVPESGAKLIVVPLPEMGQGVAEASDYADFRLLPTLQGLAIQPIADQLEVAEASDQVTISVPGGLSLSAAADESLPAALPKLNGTLLDPADWQGKSSIPYVQRRQALMHSVVTASDDDRTPARIALARFEFANAMAAESLGVLRRTESDVPNLTDDPTIRLMQGAAEEMMHQLDAAATDLNDPSLDGRVDTALWRAKLAADQSNWKDAATLGQQGIPALRSYPPALRRRLSLPIADAMFWAGDKAAAEKLADDVMASKPTRGERDYAMCLQGRLAADKNDIPKALALWEAVAKSPDIDLGRAQAAYALAVTKYDKKQISRTDAIAAIDRLRYAWRGDDFELLVLRKLADLYADDGNYRLAFETLQRVPQAYPDSQAARDAAAQMQKIFIDIFLGPNSDTMAPLTSLSLYDQFKELTPSGEQGDAIIRKLADRLVAVDLLDQAASLLDNQVRTRLSGVEQARVGAQLALIRLMDHKPADASAILDLPVNAELPPDLSRQRTELRARAMAELDKPDAALQLIAADSSEDADRLRGEIYLKTQNWSQLAGLLMKGLPKPDTGAALSADNAATIVQIATAMALGQDKAGLATLQKHYGPRMDSTPSRDAFRVIAGDAGASGGDPRTIADRVAQVSDLQGFMLEYRQKLQQTKLSAIN